jgi:uncharacterized protein
VSILPDKPWKPEWVLLLGGAIFLSLVAGLLVVAGLGHWFPDLTQPHSGFVQFVVGAIFFQGAALLWIHLFLRAHGVGWREAFGFSLARAGRVAGWTALALVVSAPLTMLLGKLAEAVLIHLGLTPGLQLPVKLLLDRPSPSQAIVFGCGAVLLVPVAEEMLFRGILYPTLKQSGHRQLAMLGTSLVFASFHGNLMAFVPLTFLGVVLTWLYEKTGNLLAPILTHALFNGLNFTLALLQPQWLKMS